MIESELGSRKSAPGRGVFGMVAGVRYRRLVWLFTRTSRCRAGGPFGGAAGGWPRLPVGQFLIVRLEAWVPFLRWYGLQCPMR